MKISLSEYSDFIEFLQANNEINIDSTEITSSKFYQDTQTATGFFFDSLYRCTDPEILMITSIVSKSHTITSVDFSNMEPHMAPKMGVMHPNLDEQGRLMVAISNLISKSQSIEAVNFQGNNLGKFGPAVVDNLVESNKITDLNLSDCSLYEHAIPTIQMLKDSTIKNLTIIKSQYQHSASPTTNLKNEFVEAVLNSAVRKLDAGYAGMAPQFKEYNETVKLLKETLLSEGMISSLVTLIGDEYLGSMELLEYGELPV